MGPAFYRCRLCPFETRDRAEFFRHRQGHILQAQAEKRAVESRFTFTAEKLENLKGTLFS